MRKSIWWMAAGLGLFLLYSLTVQRTLERVHVGQVAPLFGLAAHNGEITNLADLRGNVVLVNFWATWCGLCVSEIPSLNSLAGKFAGRSFRVIGVSEDGESGGGWAAIDSFSRQVPLGFAVLLDSDGHVADTYGAYAIPQSFIIDREGKIARVIEGPVSVSDRSLVDFIDSLLQ